MALVVRGTNSLKRERTFEIAGVVAFIVAWCALSYGGFIKSQFLPSPSDVWAGLVSFSDRHWLIPAVIGSTTRVLHALVFTVLVGVPIGVLMGAFLPVDAFIRWPLSGLKSVPTTGLIGLIILWFGLSENAKVVFLVMGSIFYMVMLVRDAIANVRQDFIDVGRDLNATSLDIIVKILLPAALPLIWGSLIVCSGIMWTYIVLAEFVSSSEAEIGVGYLIQVASRQSSSGRMFAALIIIAIVSVLLDAVMNLIKRKYFNW